MIELINVSKYYQTDIGRHYVLRDVSLEIPRDINVAIIGANGSGKSTTLRLIAGVDTPNSGKIIRTGRISWPMGLTPGVQQSLNGYENARFACRIYGMPHEQIRDTIEKVRSIADIGKYFELPVNTYSAGMRQRLSFAISISLDFDYYLFDEIGAGGDRRFKKLANELIEKRLNTSNFIMVSHAPADILELCQAAILLRDGAAICFDDVREALAEYGEADTVRKIDSRKKAQARREKRRAKKDATSDAAAEDAAAFSDTPAAPKRKKKARRKKLRAARRAKRAERKAAGASPHKPSRRQSAKEAEVIAKPAEAASPLPAKNRTRKQTKRRLERRKLRRLALVHDKAEGDSPASSSAPESRFQPENPRARGGRKRRQKGRGTGARISANPRLAARRKRPMSQAFVDAPLQIGPASESVAPAAAPHAAASKIHALAESWSTRSKPPGQAPLKRDPAE